MSNIVLKVDKLSIYNQMTKKIYLDDVNIRVYDNKITAIIGSSGSGKSLLLSALLGVLPPIFHVEGFFRYNIDEQMEAFSDYESYSHFLAANVYGKGFGFITQNPSSVLDTNTYVGDQIIDYLKHTRYKNETLVTYNVLFSDAIRLLKEVGMPEIEKTWNSYVYELSGGMKQKLVIALSLATNPKVLFCDEPLSSLDIDSKFQIMNVLKKKGISLLWISHNLHLVAKYADVLYAVKDKKTIGPIVK